MSKVSALRKLGVAAGVARNAAQDQAGRSRTFTAILAAVRATARSFGHTLHQLWLEVTGTVFLFMAVFGSVALIREYSKYQAGHATASRVAIATCFTLAFAWFALSSFGRARRKGQRS